MALYDTLRNYAVKATIGTVILGQFMFPNYANTASKNIGSVVEKPSYVKTINPAVAIQVQSQKDKLQEQARILHKHGLLNNKDWLKNQMYDGNPANGELTNILLASYRGGKRTPIPNAPVYHRFANSNPESLRVEIYGSLPKAVAKKAEAKAKVVAKAKPAAKPAAKRAVKKKSKPAKELLFKGNFRGKDYEFDKQFDSKFMHQFMTCLEDYTAINGNYKANKDKYKAFAIRFRDTNNNAVWNKGEDIFVNFAWPTKKGWDSNSFKADPSVVGTYFIGVKSSMQSKAEWDALNKQLRKELQGLRAANTVASKPAQPVAPVSSRSLYSEWLKYNNGKGFRDYINFTRSPQGREWIAAVRGVKAKVAPIKYIAQPQAPPKRTWEAGPSGISTTQTGADIVKKAARRAVLSKPIDYYNLENIAVLAEKIDSRWRAGRLGKLGKGDFAQLYGESRAALKSNGWVGLRDDMVNRRDIMRPAKKDGKYTAADVAPLFVLYGIDDFSPSSLEKKLSGFEKDSRTRTPDLRRIGNFFRGTWHGMKHDWRVLRGRWIRDYDKDGNLIYVKPNAGQVGLALFNQVTALRPVVFRFKGAVGKSQLWKTGARVGSLVQSAGKNLEKGTLEGVLNAGLNISQGIWSQNLKWKPTATAVPPPPPPPPRVPRTPGNQDGTVHFWTTIR